MKKTKKSGCEVKISFSFILFWSKQKHCKVNNLLNQQQFINQQKIELFKLLRSEQARIGFSTLLG